MPVMHADMEQSEDGKCCRANMPQAMLLIDGQKSLSG